MATIASKASEKVLIIDAGGQGVIRQLSFSSQWSEVRLGFFFSMVGTGGDNTNGVTEVIPINSIASNALYFGLKSSGTDLPGTGSKPQFLGIMTSTIDASFEFQSVCSQDESPFFGPYGVSHGQLSSGTLLKQPFNCVAFYGSGTQPIQRAFPQFDHTSMEFPADVTPSTNYSGFFGLRILNTEINSGVYRFDMYAVSQRTQSGADYSVDALTNLLAQSEYEFLTQDVYFDTNIAAIPSYFFLRLPFSNNRMRISCIKAISSL